jgi:hypothetical protein
MPEPEESKPPSENLKSAEDAVGELPFGKIIWAFLFKEGKAVKSGWVAVLVITGFSFWGGSEWRKGKDEESIRKSERETAEATGAKMEAERDRDKYQVIYNQDENSMADLRRLANEKFALAPPDKRIDLLIGKMEQLQNDVDSSLQAIAPRKITPDQRKAFIQSLKDAPKGHVAVITLSTGAEIASFAYQVRSMLDDAGYSDPDNKTVVPSLASCQSSDPAGSMLAALSTDVKLPFIGPIQSALISIGIPAYGTIDKIHALNLKPGELAFVIMAR